MSRLLAALLLGLAVPPAAAQQSGETEPAEPLRVDVLERATVRLVVVDVVVVDKDGRTVPGLQAEDFEIRAGGEWLPVDTLDVDCPAQPLDEPRAVAQAAKRTAPEWSDEGGRIVLAFDYQHLARPQREAAIEQAKALVRSGATGGDEIMVAALTGGLRVERTFSDEPRAVLTSLERMQYDISLWNGNFAHRNEIGFTEGFTALLEVAGTLPGPKAIVLFSGMTDVPLDLQFQKLAALAASTRCSIYPVDPGGLRPDATTMKQAVGTAPDLVLAAPG